MPEEVATPPLGLIDTSTAARVAAVSQVYVRRLITEGRVRAFRIAGNWVIDSSSFDDYLRNRRPAGRPPKVRLRVLSS